MFRCSFTQQLRVESLKESQTSGEERTCHHLDKDESENDAEAVGALRGDDSAGLIIAFLGRLDVNIRYHTLSCVSLLLAAKPETATTCPLFLGCIFN